MVEFDAAAISLDGIASLVDRRTVGELLFAREESLALADIHDVEAEESEGLANDGDQLHPRKRRKLLAVARRQRVLAARERWRARHREQEILEQLQRKDG